MSFLERDYMAKQPHVNARMREILVLWMNEVAREWKLVPETLHIAVSLIDKFLTRETISIKEFQLLGASALFTACKYEEVMPPPVSDFVYVCADAYSSKDIVDMERLLLNVVAFRLHFRTAYSYLAEDKDLHKIDKQAAVDATNRCIARYDLLKHSPEMLVKGVLHHFGLGTRQSRRETRQLRSVLQSILGEQRDLV